VERPKANVVKRSDAGAMLAEWIKPPETKNSLSLLFTIAARRLASLLGALLRWQAMKLERENNDNL